MSLTFYYYLVTVIVIVGILGETDLLTNCVVNIIRENSQEFNSIGLSFASGNSSLQRSLQTTSIDDTPSTFLHKIMEAGFGTVQTISEKMPPIPQHKLKKNPDFAFMVIWLPSYKEETIKRMLNVIKSFRAIGPKTKVIAILQKQKGVEQLVADVFLYIWKSIRSFYTCILTFNNSKVDAYNYYPFTSDGTINVTNIICFENNMLNNCTFFPALPIYFKDYTVNIAARDLPPMSIGFPPIGPEPNMIEAVANFYNININYQICDNIGMDSLNGYPTVWYNISTYVSDILSMVVPLRYEVIHNLLGLPTHNSISVNVFGPKMIKTTKFLQLFHAFQATVWASTFLVLILFSLIVFVGRPSKPKMNMSLHNLFFTFGSMHFDNPVNLKKLRVQFPFLLILFLIYILIMVASYKSKLTSMHSLAAENRTIKDLKEALDEKLLVYLPNLMIEGDPITEETTIWVKFFKLGRIRFFNDISNATAEAIAKKKGIIVIGKRELHYELNQHYRNEGGEGIASALDYDDISLYLQVATSPGYPLQPLFYKKFLQLLEGGFQEHWLNLILAKVYDNNNKFKGPLPITLDEAAVIMHLAVFCLSISFIVFIFEFVHKYLTEKRNKMYHL